MNSIGLVLAWCPGQNAPCDPCRKVVQAGQVELVGNGFNNTAHLVAGGSILSFPEFPLIVTANIALVGLYRPLVGTIPGGGGSTTLSGSSYTLGVDVPFPPTAFTLPPGWTPNSNDLLLFNVTASSSTTSYAALSTGSVDVLYQDQTTGLISKVNSKVRWTGNVT